MGATGEGSAGTSNGKGLFSGDDFMRLDLCNCNATVESLGTPFGPPIKCVLASQGIDTIGKLSTISASLATNIFREDFCYLSVTTAPCKSFVGSRSLNLRRLCCPTLPSASFRTATRVSSPPTMVAYGALTLTCCARPASISSHTSFFQQLQRATLHCPAKKLLCC